MRRLTTLQAILCAVFVTIFVAGVGATLYRAYSYFPGAPAKKSMQHVTRTHSTRTLVGPSGNIMGAEVTVTVTVEEDAEGRAK